MFVVLLCLMVFQDPVVETRSQEAYFKKLKSSPTASGLLSGKETFMSTRDRSQNFAVSEKSWHTTPYQSSLEYSKSTTYLFSADNKEGLVRTEYVPFDRAINSEGSLSAHNNKYQFAITRKSNTSPWSTKTITDISKRRGQVDTTKFDLAMRMMDNLPWSCHGAGIDVAAILGVYGPNGYRMEDLVEQHSESGPLMTVKANMTPIVEGLHVREVMFKLNKKHGYRLEEYLIVSQWGDGEKSTKHGIKKYSESDPMQLKSESVRVANDYEDTTVYYTFKVLPPPDPSVFLLSAYGLPEPAPYDFQISPMWSYCLVIASLCVLATAAFTRKKR